MKGPDREDILFVGDIQGCLEPLQRLLREAAYSPDRHRLIPVGDTINRGPDNVGVLALLRSLGAEPIVGNHEARLLQVAGRDPEPPWLQRQSVSRDLLVSPRREDWLDWMRSWPLWRRGDDAETGTGEGRGWIAVHAGMHPVLALEQAPADFLLTVRVCDAQGNLPTDWDPRSDEAPAGFRPWYDFYEGADTVVYGHWAWQGLHRTVNTRGLDSGCVYGKALSGWWLSSDTIVQVPGQS